MIFQLPEEPVFPHPALGEPNGLLAVGGDLSAERLLNAYANGIFPWYDWHKGEIQWWAPMRRFVIFPHEIHISHSMRTLLRKNLYTVTVNQNFAGVIAGCAEGRQDQEGAWLGPDMIAAFTRLHDMGYARSVEVWRGIELVGGLYGMCMGGVFVGESMFSRVPSASKVALIGLSNWVSQCGAHLIDCQLHTPHLESMGGRYIPYNVYMKYLLGE